MFSPQPTVHSLQQSGYLDRIVLMERRLPRCPRFVQVSTLPSRSILTGHCRYCYPGHHLHTRTCKEVYQRKDNSHYLGFQKSDANSTGSVGNRNVQRCGSVAYLIAPNGGCAWRGLAKRRSITVGWCGSWWNPQLEEQPPTPIHAGRPMDDDTFNKPLSHGK